MKLYFKNFLYFPNQMDFRHTIDISWSGKREEVVYTMQSSVIIHFV